MASLGSFNQGHHEVPQEVMQMIIHLVIAPTDDSLLRYEAEKAPRSITSVLVSFEGFVRLNMVRFLGKRVVAI